MVKRWWHVGGRHRHGTSDHVWTAWPARFLEERDRWFLWAPVLLGIGIALYFTLPKEPALSIILGACSLTLYAARRWRRNAIGEPLTIGVLLIALGTLCAKVQTSFVDAPILTRTLRSVVVEGIVERVEPRLKRGPRVTLRVTEIERLAKAETPHRVRVRFMRAATDLWPGDLIRFKATLSPPARPALPGGYDFGRAAYYQRLGAVGFTLGRPQRLPAPRSTDWSLQLVSAIQWLRQWIGQRIAAGLDGDAAAIAVALMTGERGRIPDETLTAYRDSGLLHLLSISGLHMAIMGGSVFFGLRLLWAAWPGLALRAPIKKWAAVGAIVAAFGYLLISGTTHATVRAFIMIAVMMLAILIDRPAITLRNVALAAFVILAVSPVSLLHAGFQMSFAAVVALVAAYEFLRDRATHRAGDVRRGAFSTTAWFFMGIVGSTIVASLAVAPFAAFHFHKSQQYAVLANLIAVPVCNLIVMPFALLTFIALPAGLEKLTLWVMGQGIDIMTWTAQQVSGLPGAVAHLPAFSTLSFGLVVLGGLWLCLWRQNWRFWGIGLIGVGAASMPWQNHPDILVGRDGRLVAVRQQDGKLAAWSTARSAFELDRWLEHDGDDRRGTLAVDHDAYRCDMAGCTTTLGTRLVAISKAPSSIVDDCQRADVLVLPFPRPPGCDPDGPVLDFWAFRDRGTHALYRDQNGGFRITTVEMVRGDRPWSTAAFRRARIRSRSRRAAARRARQARISKPATTAGRVLPEADHEHRRFELWRDE